MKKILFVLAVVFSASLAFVGCAASNFGDQQAETRFNVAAQQIAEKENTIQELENKLADKALSAVKKAEIEKQIAELKVQIYDLGKSKDKIASDYINSTASIPVELTELEKTRRQRANTLKREAMVMEKIQQNISSVDVAKGYKIILDNQYYMPITFSFHPLDGGERVSFNLKSGEMERAYLLPGTYEVEFLSGGSPVGNSVKMTINGEKKYYHGEECFNFAYVPSR